MSNYSTTAPADKTQALGIRPNLAALICYVPLFPVNAAASILWLATEPKSSTFLRRHAAQSLVLLAAGFVFCIIAAILSTVLSMTLGAVSSTIAMVAGMVFLLLYLAAGVGLIAVSIFCMVQAYAGRQWELPFVGVIARRFA